MSKDETFLSTEDVAEVLDVTSATVARWIRTGVFPNARKKGPAINSPYVIPQSDFDAFVAQLRSQPATDHKNSSK